MHAPTASGSAWQVYHHCRVCSALPPSAGSLVKTQSKTPSTVPQTKSKKHSSKVGVVRVYVTEMNGSCMDYRDAEARTPVCCVVAAHDVSVLYMCMCMHSHYHNNMLLCVYKWMQLCISHCASRDNCVRAMYVRTYV